VLQGPVAGTVAEQDGGEILLRGVASSGSITMLLG
jgi:hypothetical protein